MDYQILGLVLAAVFMISGGLATIYKFVGTVRKEREEENEKILKLSKEYCDAKVLKLEAELSHQKDLHEGKVSELTNKIELLREEMRSHHSHLVGLLTKMVDKSNNN